MNQYKCEKLHLLLDFIFALVSFVVYLTDFHLLGPEQLGTLIWCREQQMVVE